MNGIYIENIEVPKNCYDCSFGIWSYLNQAYQCTILNNTFSFNNERPDNCPIKNAEEKTGKWIENKKDFETICICALRYAMGRKTYMPDLVRNFVRPLLPEFSDNTIAVMISDCDFQRRYNSYGDERIDKPAWLEWEKELKNEYQCRQN